MKKDGTTYLALIKYRNKTEEWEIIRWGESCGLSDCSMGWISQAGFRLREPEILEYYELDKVVKSMRYGHE